MSVLDWINGGLQTVATALIAAGGYSVYNHELRVWEGLALVAAGLVVYVVYECVPVRK